MTESDIDAFVEAAVGRLASMREAVAAAR
jgi:hypothetical protein